MWVKGLNFDWNKLYGDIKPSRLSLPTYPFAREHYWVPKNQSKFDRSNAVATIHPLLQQNTSDFSAYRFSSTFTGQEFFLTNYEVENQRVLSEVSYLEMARAAVSQAVGDLQLGETKIWLKNVVWAKPIVVVDQPIQIYIELYPEEDGDIAYEIYSKSEKNDAEPVIHSQGIAVLGSSSEIRGLNISDLQAQCSYDSLSSSQCYESYSQMGIDYSFEQQGIEKVYVGSDQVLAKLYLPSAILDTQDQFVLHPSLMDSALQASIGLMMGSDNLKMSVPFALQELDIFSKLTSGMWALIRYSNGSEAGDKVQKLTIDLCDETGNVCVQMKGLSTRILESKAYNYSNIG
jgi:polyketide synthase PksN